MDNTINNLQGNATSVSSTTDGSNLTYTTLVDRIFEPAISNCNCTHEALYKKDVEEPSPKMYLEIELAMPEDLTQVAPFVLALLDTFQDKGATIHRCSLRNRSW